MSWLCRLNRALPALFPFAVTGLIYMDYMAVDVAAFALAVAAYQRTFQ